MRRDGSRTRRGVLVRHLVMPGHTDESAAIPHRLAGSLASDTDVNLMDQYRPAYQAGRPGCDGTPA